MALVEAPSSPVGAVEEEHPGLRLAGTHPPQQPVLNGGVGGYVRRIGLEEEQLRRLDTRLVE